MQAPHHSVICPMPLRSHSSSDSVEELNILVRPPRFFRSDVEKQQSCLFCVWSSFALSLVVNNLFVLPQRRRQWQQLRLQLPTEVCCAHTHRCFSVWGDSTTILLFLSGFQFFYKPRRGSPSLEKKCLLSAHGSYHDPWD